MFLCNLVGLGATFQPGVEVDPVRARQAARGMKRAIRFGEGLIDAILDEDLEAASYIRDITESRSPGITCSGRSTRR